MFRFVIFSIFWIAFYISECSSGNINDSTSTTQIPRSQGNESNIFGLFNSLLNNTNVQNVIGSLLKGILQGGTGGNTSTPKGHVDKLNSKPNNPLGTLQQLLPMLAATGFSDPTKLIPVALSYLKSADPTLEASGVGDACRKDLNLWYQGLERFEDWAWKMIDSGFKIPSNLAGLNLKWLGNIEECTSISAQTYDNATQTVEKFGGKYCRLVFPTGGYAAGFPQTLILGSCASSRCSNNDVMVIVDTLIKAVAPANFPPIKAIVSCAEDKPKLDSKAIAVICILGVLGTFVLIGTTYDVMVIQRKSRNSEPPVLLSRIPQESPPPYMAFVSMPDSAEIGSSYQYTVTEGGKNDMANGVNNRTMMQSDKAATHVNESKKQTHPDSMVGKILVSFSIYTNGCKLLGTTQGSGSLGAVNGIRFLSMAWIILGHTYFFAMPYVANMMPLMAKKLNHWTFSAITNSSSVDTFFALSGLLVAYLTLGEIKKVGGASKFNWFMFYFHRFWRLTPPYMLVLMVGTFLYQYFVYGAARQEGDNMYMGGCRDSWWINLLYVNNYVHPDKACMGWSWYLANDMQMYILSPLIIIPFFYNVVAGGIASALFLAGTITATAVIENEHKFPVQMMSPYATQGEGDYNKLLYHPVWTRIGPYVVGLITGYALYKCKCKCRIPVVINLMCWLLCLGIISSVVYGPYSKDDTHIFSSDESTAYHTLFRTGWGVAICWIVFACATGNGGWINELLSWSPYVPLGRLTYCAYLIHPLIMLVYYDNMTDPIYISDYGIVYLFLGNLVLSYGAAFVVSLFFESPMMGLEKAIFKKK